MEFSRTDLLKIKNTLLRLNEDMDRGEWVSEEEAAKLMTVELKTLRNKRYANEIPKDVYRQTIVGTYIYFKNKLLR